MLLTSVARIGILVLATLLVCPDFSAGCTCIGEWPNFARSARDAAVVVIGRVRTQGKPHLEGRLYLDLDVAYLDVDVLEAVKGTTEGAIVRIWDSAFGGSCAMDLRPYVKGSVVAFALALNGPEMDEYWQLVPFKPAKEDLLIQSCGEYVRQLGSVKEGRKLAAELRRDVSNSC
jgi:hypothetical protein